MMTVGVYGAKGRLAEPLDLVQRSRPLTEVFAEMREARRGVRVPGMSIRDLIEEGRRL